MPAVASPPAASRSTITTLAPRPAKPRVVARPMPLPPPVTSATLFLKSILKSLLYLHRSTRTGPKELPHPYMSDEESRGRLDLFVTQSSGKLDDGSLGAPRASGVKAGPQATAVGGAKRP